MPVPPRALFSSLVDDAALFPPGNAPMDKALAEHAQHREAPYADLVGPFLCPASRVDELVEHLPPPPHFPIALVNDVTDDAALHARRLLLQRSSLAWVESRYDRLGADVSAVRGAPRTAGPMAYLEVPRTDFEDALDLVGQPGWDAAKYRTGGLAPADVPSASELAAFLVACISRGLPFKLTAGLHHAVRQHDSDGTISQHGVLNVLAAVDAASHGLTAERVSEVLDLDAEQLAAGRAEMSDEEALSIRQWFRSFGCCGVTDPIDELADLGVIDL